MFRNEHSCLSIIRIFRNGCLSLASLVVCESRNGNKYTFFCRKHPVYSAVLHSPQCVHVQWVFRNDHYRARLQAEGQVAIGQGQVAEGQGQVAEGQGQVSEAENATRKRICEEMVRDAVREWSANKRREIVLDCERRLAAMQAAEVVMLHEKWNMYDAAEQIEAEDKEKEIIALLKKKADGVRAVKRACRGVGLGIDECLSECCREFYSVQLHNSLHLGIIKRESGEAGGAAGGGAAGGGAAKLGTAGGAAGGGAAKLGTAGGAAGSGSAGSAARLANMSFGICWKAFNAAPDERMIPRITAAANRGDIHTCHCDDCRRLTGNFRNLCTCPLCIART